jgi:3-oxoacyl-[acyl-carrier protein] reductase
VTGAASGVGKATVRLLSATGAVVWATDVRPDIGSAAPDQVTWRQGDIGDEEFVRSLAGDLSLEVGHVDAVVHCAGVFDDRVLADTETVAWEQTLRTNLTSGFLLLKHCQPLLARSENPSVTLVGSVAGLNGGERCGPAYAASKAGLHGLAKWAARQWAPDGVRVNVIAPGPLDTPMSRDLGLVAERVPLGRLGNADEIAALAAYISSPDAAWITGQVISPNGGTLIC